jgi:hypothetical protein
MGTLLQEIKEGYEKSQKDRSLPGSAGAEEADKASG